MSSFSRPSVSNDNPYSESLFRTVKYRPEYPEKAFNDLQTTRIWVKNFVSWYNTEHLHSAIKFVTLRHQGDDINILANRMQVYQRARLSHPERWSGDIRNGEPINKVHLNPEKFKTKIKENKAAQFLTLGDNYLESHRSRELAIDRLRVLVVQLQAATNEVLTLPPFFVVSKFEE